MDTTVNAQAHRVIIKNTVSHGDYFAEFYGVGSSILEAAEDAARQSSYSSELFDQSDSYYERRAEYRAALVASLESAQTYRGFGWNNFSRIS